MCIYIKRHRNPDRKKKKTDKQTRDRGRIPHGPFKGRFPRKVIRSIGGTSFRPPPPPPWDFAWASKGLVRGAEGERGREGRGEERRGGGGEMRGGGGLERRGVRGERRRKGKGKGERERKRGRISRRKRRQKRRGKERGKERGEGEVMQREV